MSDDRKKVLWIDNDTGQIVPYEVALRQAGFHVTVVPTVSEGEALVASDNFALVILDVMISVTEEEEAGEYKPEETANTYKTGLVFYARVKAKLNELNTPAVVMTVRNDQQIANEFVAAGLPADCLFRKFEVREAHVFVDRIRAVLRRYAVSPEVESR